MIRNTILVLAASALALANTQLSGLQTHAANVERECLALSKLLKAKSPDMGQLRVKLDAAGADIERLKALATELEASPTFDRNSPAWQMVKERVQLLDIFHHAKRHIVTAEEVSKKRGLLRAHAEGVAKRAASLQQSVNRLAKP
jgi:hypothetical protein